VGDGLFHTDGQTDITKLILSPITGPRYPDGSRKLRFPDYVTMAQKGDKFVSFTHRPLFYPQEIFLVLISVRG